MSNAKAKRIKHLKLMNLLTYQRLAMQKQMISARHTSYLNRHERISRVMQQNDIDAIFVKAQFANFKENYKQHRFKT